MWCQQCFPHAAIELLGNSVFAQAPQLREVVNVRQRIRLDDTEDSLETEFNTMTLQEKDREAGLIYQGSQLVAMLREVLGGVPETPEDTLPPRGVLSLGVLKT